LLLHTRNQSIKGDIGLRARQKERRKTGAKATQKKVASRPGVRAIFRRQNFNRQF